MQCDATRELFTQYDGLLMERQRLEAAMEHLKVCPACHAALADYAALRGLLQNRDDLAEPREGWLKFQERLNDSTAQPSHRMIIGWRSATAVAASIALLALSIVASSYLKSSNRDTNNVALIASGSQYKPAEIPQQVQTFAKVSEAFDNRAAWMLISDHTSDVGVAQAAIPDHTLLVLKLTLLHSGAIVSNANLILVPGQQADLSLPSSDGKTLHYRISASPSAPMSLSLWLGIENAQATSDTIAALSTQLPLASDQVVSAGQLATVTGTYELKVGFVRANSTVGSATLPTSSTGGLQ